MNENVKAIAKRAGFVLWGNEEWNPGDVIDWASRYDDEFVRYTQLLVQEVLELNEAGTDVLSYYGIAASDGKESIDVELSDEEMLQYMLLAHERDITFNKFIELALRKAIDEHKTEGAEDASTEAG
jgi:hypothetical protein